MDGGVHSALHILKFMHPNSPYDLFDHTQQRMYHPQRIYVQHTHIIVAQQQIDLRTGFGIHEGEAINDFAWFPSMNSQGILQH